MPFITDEDRTARSNPPWLIILIGVAVLVILFVIVAFVFSLFAGRAEQGTAVPAAPTSAPAK